MASRIPFPNRFYAAVGFAANPPLGARAVADETRLLLYALYQQATAGPCRAPKPWGWNAIESAKWSSWTQLGDTAAIDAMRMYVSTMEEENPDWFSLFTDGGDPARVAEVLEAYRERRDFVVDALNAIEGVECPVPAGAFYAFPDVSSFGMSSKALADLLLEEGGVAVLPGTDFGENGEGKIRISYVGDMATLEEGMKRIADTLETLR